ncbi:hypothetical protein [Streptomyces sp. NPDC058755]
METSTKRITAILALLLFVGIGVQATADSSSDKASSGVFAVGQHDPEWG